MTIADSTTVSTRQSSTLVRRLDILEAKKSLRLVLHRYARGADRADIELFKRHADDRACLGQAIVDGPSAHVVGCDLRTAARECNGNR